MTIIISIHSLTDWFPELHLEGIPQPCPPAVLENASAKFDLVYEYTPREGKTYCTLEFSTDIFLRPTIECLARSMQVQPEFTHSRA